jgi:hypothetical protein
MVTLDTFTFPDGVIWSDRLGFSPVAQAKSYLLTGKILIESQPIVSGRPITISSGSIEGSKYSGLFNNAEVEALQALFDDPLDPERTLTIGSTQYRVMFDRTEAGLKVEELIQVEAGYSWQGRIYRVTTSFITTQGV